MAVILPLILAGPTFRIFKFFNKLKSNTCADELMFNKRRKPRIRFMIVSYFLMLEFK
jgi:hypothetical protein